MKRTPFYCVLPTQTETPTSGRPCQGLHQERDLKSPMATTLLHFAGNTRAGPWQERDASKYRWDQSRSTNTQRDLGCDGCGMSPGQHNTREMPRSNNTGFQDIIQTCAALCRGRGIGSASSRSRSTREIRNSRHLEACNIEGPNRNGSFAD